jgi:hypothetical protein
LCYAVVSIALYTLCAAQLTVGRNNGKMS